MTPIITRRDFLKGTTAVVLGAHLARAQEPAGPAVAKMYTSIFW